MKDIFLEAFTDGGFTSKPTKQGSFGYTIQYASEIIEGSGLVEHHKQTSQVAELTAFIKCLEKVKEIFGNNEEYLQRIRVKIYSDSQYGVNGATDWMYTWRRNDWEGKENVDLWKQIYKLAVNTFKSVTFEWVRGHDGNPGNERVDRLCNIALGRKVK